MLLFKLFYQKYFLKKKTAAHFLETRNILRSSCSNFTVASQKLQNIRPCVIFLCPLKVTKNIYDGYLSWLYYVKTLTALYEYHQSTQSAYRNKQIIQACFARMSQCVDHKTYILIPVNIFPF